MTLAALLLIVRSVFSADVTLAWDPPTDGITTGYLVSYGAASGSYSQQTDVGPATTYVASGLSNGTYYFAVRAYDANGNISGFSNEASATLAPAKIASLSLVSNVPSPQPVGFYVTWTATATGGVTPYQFQFWQQKVGGAWTLARDWSSVATWSWAPTTGDYNVRVDARSAGATVMELSQSMPFSFKKCAGKSCK